ncbi:C-C chemokine receptor type 8-like [Gastrophryne carolinensis]
MSVSTSTSPTIDYGDWESYMYFAKSLTPMQSIFKPFLYCIIFFCGLVGNSLVLSILIWFKKLASVTDIYLLNMAISDLIFVFSLPFVVYSIQHQWIFGNVMCKILSAMYYTGFFSGIFFITILSVDRYLAIVHAVFSLKFRTMNKAIIITLAVWIFSFLLSLPHFIYHKQLSSNEITDCALSYPEDQRRTLTLLSYLQVNIFGLIVPLAVLIFCYSRIIGNLRNSRSRQKKYAVKLIFIIVLVFFLFWAPYNIVVFLKILEGLGILGSSAELQMAEDITQTISFVHCCLNPFIYTFAGENFKKHLFRMLSKLLKFLRLRNICSHDTDQVSSSFRESRSSSYTDMVM